MSDHRYVVGIDIGGTKTAVGVVSDEGHILHQGECPTDTKGGPEQIIRNACQLVVEMDDYAAAQGLPLLAIGIGSAGVVEPGTGRISSATDAIPGWTGTELRQDIQKITGLPTWAENDVHAHGRAEAWLGAGKDASSMLLVAIGTGVGGAFVIDGQSFLGQNGVAGLVGHYPIPQATGIDCTCGGEGHFEALCSGPAILDAYKRAGGSAKDTREVEELAINGEDLAKRVFQECATATGQALGGLANLLDPEVIVLGGGMANAGDLYWEPLRAAYQAELIPFLKDKPLYPAKLGRYSGIIGAAKLAFANLD
ncbi:hypothetical protein BSR29_05980 [Boudabousia liubingyangii]|uniref:Glucokinase n=1 Tax=Boudabousia liubingyangii TaxID=1921764 RepID=A0A1Q5PKK6_9ACTO|nr:ROK family protein [Boudabousia liubingyangii]OKL46507.1 hypothetical protein BSR28_08300 [Boudabousia liubingyangii]OKL47172.1 hypothetical protein BSR29_05980 [Boudabousia liubingyangii]